jgi:hypothetical protein
MVDDDIRIENGHKLIIETPSGGDSNVKISAITVGPDPILFIDRGIKGYKDLNLYGFVGISTDEQKIAGGGAIMMGHGFTSSMDPPRISLTDSELVNRILYSENFLNDDWTSYDGSKSNISNGYLCPDNTNNTACKFTQCGQSGQCRGCWQSASPSLQQNKKYTASIWLKGTYDDQPVIIGLNDTYNSTVNLTQNWQRYFYTVTIPSGGNTSRGLQFNSGITGDTYYAWGAQLEEVSPLDPDGYHRSYVKTEDAANSKFDTLHLYRADGSTPANLDLGNLAVHGQLKVDSSGLVTNLNADLLDGLHLWEIFVADIFIDAFYDKLNDSLAGSFFELVDNILHLKTTATPTLGGLTVNGLTNMVNLAVNAASGAGITLANGNNISMNQGTLILDNSDNKAGYIQFGLNLSSTARLAQVNISGQNLPVLAVQSYVTSGGKFGAWDLGILDVSTMFVDHINSASAGGIYLFDNLRLHWYDSSTQTHHYQQIYDENDQVGTSGQFLQIGPHGPTWTTYTPAAWNGGTVTNNIISSQASQSNSMLQGFKSGEANSCFAILVSGEMYWGAGGASAADTNLYRSAADTLKTDDAFVHGGLVTLNYSGEVDLDFKADNTGGWRFFERNSDNTLGIYSLSGSQTYLRFVAGATKQVKVEADNGLYVINDHKVGGTIYTQNDVVFTANNYNVHLSPVASNVLTVKDNNGSLAVIEGATAKVDHLNAATAGYIYSWNHLKMTTYANIYSETSNTAFCGLAENYWGAVYAAYLMYKTSHQSFDALDDLTIAKSLTTVKETRIIDEKTKETAEFDVIDREQLKFLEAETGFYSPDKVNGYLLGCVKALVLRIEALENQLANQAAA